MLQLVSATPVEHEVYFKDPELRDLCDNVGQMILDLHDEDFELEIVLAMNDYTNPDEFTLAFSGSALALDFYPDRIDITDFDHSEDDEEEVCETFGRTEVNRATTCLVNMMHDRV